MYVFAWFSDIPQIVNAFIKHNVENNPPQLYFIHYNWINILQIFQCFFVQL